MAGTVLNMIGLARRAGQVESGDAAVRNSVCRGRARLIILAGDAAERTREAFGRLARDYGIPLVVFGTKEGLGGILGKPPRSVVAVTGENFARGIVKIIERGEVFEK
ncbi:MAG: ribosomal L7Ae/L30e/S12e/Gadd45 family protein [Peptococcaceae bacterium]|nr:ribosomal L7Ae/L30e/S12e/Gadd45 family protein [Peptococcaceae bacterium]